MKEMVNVSWMDGMAFEASVSGKKIIWLVGHRSSNDFRVTKSTKNIFQMEI